ncbi:MFS transporter [Pseudooceanicola sp. LIPI14-2-Ac024]|uniref:MFS transporter n=1 Tax=Pseudooceanicola sp. LIPI14-2-Ac024 TaxID=3344875 RepID=UPI0035CFFB02
MRLMFTLAPLFLSVVLLQLSTGGVGPLDALSGIELGFTTGQIGLLGSAHFVGFFIGCWWAPRLMGSVGHSRAFSAFTATGAIGLLAHMLIIDPYAWALMRVASGLCVAGCYTVIEGWMMARLTNAERGRVMGGYRLIDMGASLAAQTMIGFLAPATYVSYNILAILCCAAIFPLTLTKSEQPAMTAQPRLRPGLAWTRSPLAVAAVIVSALSAATFRMIGPLYGQEVGLAANQIAGFLSIYILGGAIAQFPAGWLADKFDRRWVLIWISAAAIVSCLLAATTSDGFAMVMLNAALFGFTTFPVYSIAAAHAHDFATSEERAELSAALLFFYALGAIAAPWTASQLIAAYGPGALFAMVGAGHVVLLVFGLVRMRVRPTREARTPYVWAPRTSFFIGRLFRQARDREDGTT